MIELLYAIPTFFLCYLLWRADRRYDVAEQTWRLERTALLNRLTNPEVEVAKEFRPAESVPAIPFDDDEAWWKSRNGES